MQKKTHKMLWSYLLTLSVKPMSVTLKNIYNVL